MFVLSLQDMIDAMRDVGVLGGGALGVLSSFGAGVTTYKEEKSTPFGGKSIPNTKQFNREQALEELKRLRK